MARHLKSIVKKNLKGIIDHYVPNADVSASHRRGVCYFVPIVCFDSLWGTMNDLQKGCQRQKHIVVHRVPRYKGHVLQLYTYHFPKTWSAACVANRELIKTAQKLAHALEHDHSLASLEWRVRFFRHYFRVVKGGAKPEPGLKPYSRFYQYAYVSIYRELQSARLTASVADRAQQEAQETLCTSVASLQQPSDLSSDVSFEPIPVVPEEPILRRPTLRTAIRPAPIPRVDAIDPPGATRTGWSCFRAL